jgi:hypothetical protein
MTKKHHFDGCVERTLVVSTAHITSRDNELLQALVERKNRLDLKERYRLTGNYIEDYLDVLGYEHGFMIPARQHYAECREPAEIACFEQSAVDSGLSTAFVALIRVAAEEGYTWLQLDADADVVDSLPCFEWSPS